MYRKASRLVRGVPLGIEYLLEKPNTYIQSEQLAPVAISPLRGISPPRSEDRRALWSWLEPDQELVVAEVADQGAAFGGVPTESGVVGLSAADVQYQQRRAFPGQRMHLEGGEAAGIESGQRRGKQLPGWLG